MTAKATEKQLAVAKIKRKIPLIQIEIKIPSITLSIFILYI